MYPYLLHAGHLYLPTFGALAALGLMLALVLSERTARLRGLPVEPVWNAGIAAVVAAFVLSRLLLVVAHFDTFRRFPVLLLAVPSLTPTGVLLTLIATLTWVRWKRLPILPVLDAWAPCATLVWCALALGHFAEGSDPGMMTVGPLGMHLPGSATALYPVAFYTALVAATVTIVLYRRLLVLTSPGRVAGEALVWTGIAQFFLSFLRQPVVDPVLGLDPLEWLALAMILLGAMLIWLPQRARIMV